MSTFRVVVALALLAGMTACGNHGGNAGGPQMPAPEVTVAVVESGDAPITFDASGRIIAYRTAQVRARVEGILEKRLYKEGGEVEEGQPLFRIDPRTLEANVASAKAAVTKAHANAEVAAQTVTRYRQLIKDQAISKQELDQAEAQLKQAEAEVLNSEAALKRAQIDLSHANVPAPISGRTTRALVTEGQLVGRGEATHLATIEQLHPIYVDFTQSGADRLRLQKAFMSGELKRAQAPVELILEDGTHYKHRGKILFSEQTVDPNTGTVTLRAEFPNPERLLLPGMFATVRFAPGMLGHAVKVPQRAVQASPQGQYVYVVDGENKVVPQPIETGGFSGPDWIVTAGLKGGERVIVDGLQKVRPGAVVNPVVANAAPAQAPGAAGQAPAAQTAPAGKAPAAAAAPAAKEPARAGKPGPEPAKPAAPSAAQR